MATKKYKCKVCGYIHEGDKAPDVCPLCAAPSSDFEEIKPEKKGGMNRDSNAYTIIYASVMVLLVAVVLVSRKKMKIMIRDSRSCVLSMFRFRPMRLKRNMVN